MTILLDFYCFLFLVILSFFMSFFHYFLIIVIKCTFCYKIYFLLVTYSKLYSNPLFLPNIRKKLQNSTCNEKNVYYVYLIKLYWFYIYAAFSNTCVALGVFSVVSAPFTASFYNNPNWSIKNGRLDYINYQFIEYW